MIIEDDDLVIDEVDNTEEENLEISEDSVNVESENEPATIQDEVDEDEEEDRIVTIGDSEPEPEEESEGEEEEKQKDPVVLVKKLRSVAKGLEKKNKALQRQLEEKTKSVEVEEPIELGEEPTLKACGYDDVKYKQEIRAYDDKKKKVEEQAAKKAKVVEEQTKAWKSRQEKYVNLKKEHSFKDFEDVEATVSETLSQAQQSMIVAGADDAALLVYALGKNPKKLKELADINDLATFAFKVAKLESQLKVTDKKAPKPETRVKTGKSGGISGSSDKVLERLREDAAKSGDYTQVTAYKNKLRKG